MFIVPLMPFRNSYRQDGNLWGQRAMDVLDDLIGAQDRAMNVKIALRRDELTKETNDNFLGYVLG